MSKGGTLTPESMADHEPLIEVIESLDVIRERLGMTPPDEDGSGLFGHELEDALTGTISGSPARLLDDELICPAANLTYYSRSACPWCDRAPGEDHGKGVII